MAVGLGYPNLISSLTQTLEELKAALADRYLLERELGRGGMATVYLARDLRHDRPVALKVLHPELAHALGPERFIREIRLAARLDHPHILSVHDSGETAGRLWFTMPYVEGESLRNRLAREPQLPLADALRITRAVADALGYAQRQGIIHRDVKPENILLQGERCVLADFGVARAVDAAGERLTETGFALGTPAYMSPEQAAADRHLDPRSDIYSLGCVVYEMLAGEPPFTGRTAQAIIARRLADPVPDLCTVRDVPRQVERAVRQALARAPADRFADAPAFARALEAAAGDTRASTRPAVRRGLLAAVGGAPGRARGAGVWLRIRPRRRSARDAEPARGCAVRRAGSVAPALAGGAWGTCSHARSTARARSARCHRAWCSDAGAAEPIRPPPRSWAVGPARDWSSTARWCREGGTR